MTDTPNGAGLCVGGWVKGVPDWDDIRTAHWTASPPSFPSSPNHHHQPTTNYPMSFENVVDFQTFFDGGCEGSYSSNKENKGQIVAFWLSVPTNAIIQSYLSKGRSPGSRVTTCAFGLSFCPLPL